MSRAHCAQAPSPQDSWIFFVLPQNDRRRWETQLKRGCAKFGAGKSPRGETVRNISVETVTLFARDRRAISAVLALQERGRILLGYC